MASIRCQLAAALLAVALGAAAPARAVFVVSADPADPRAATGYRNTAEPTGALAGSGWQFQGLWGNFLGTPIGPHHFLTAAHIGVQPGPFVLGGRAFTPVESSFDPDGGDLQVVRVLETFDAFAPLFTAGDEVGRDLVAFGRGFPRGEPVTLPREGGVLKGWMWGQAEVDSPRSWGENRVTALVDRSAAQPDEYLAFTFDVGGPGYVGPNESSLAGQDSGGAVFLLDGGVWKLAGINYGVSGPFGDDADGTGSFFNAALFDRGGFFDQSVGASGLFLPDRAGDLSSASFSTRVAANLDFIGSIVPAAVPEPGSLGLLACGAIGGLGLRAMRRRGTGGRGGNSPEIRPAVR